MTKARHLHRDYDTAFCGIDISHVLATYDRGDASCKKCLAAAEAADRQAEEEHRAAEAEDARIAAELGARHADEDARTNEVEEAERLLLDQYRASREATDTDAGAPQEA